MEQIKKVGLIKEGLPSEVVDGCVRLYDAEGYPIIELYGKRDDAGNLLTMEEDLAELAKELRVLWNARIGLIEDEVRGQNEKNI